MQLNIRSRPLRFCICSFAALVLLIGVLAFWPSKKPELAWRLLAMTQTNGECVAVLELSNSGQVSALAFDFAITADEKDVALNIGPNRGPTEIGPGEQVQITASLLNSVTEWAPHANWLPSSSEVKLAVWIERKGWEHRFPEFLHEVWRNRFKKQTVMVSGGPFTNSPSQSSK